MSQVGEIARRSPGMSHLWIPHPVTTVSSLQAAGTWEGLGLQEGEFPEDLPWKLIAIAEMIAMAAMERKFCTLPGAS